MKSKEAITYLREHTKYYEPVNREAFRIIEEDLERLEQIDNANPSEALKSFERLNEDDSDYALKRATKDIEIVKQALLKAQEQDKILDILKQHISIDVATVYNFDTNKDERIEFVVFNGKFVGLNDEEDITIKEWLDGKD